MGGGGSGKEGLASTKVQELIFSHPFGRRPVAHKKNGALGPFIISFGSFINKMKKVTSF